MPFTADSFKNADTVTKQLLSSVNASTLTGPASGLRTAASSVSGAVGNLGSSLLAAGQSAFNSGLSALNQLGSFTTVTKFADNLRPPSPITQPRPEQFKGRIESPVGNLVYPKDQAPRYSITFIFEQFFKDSPLVPKKNRPSVSITLPMPSDLVDKFSAEYSNKDLGLLGKALQEGGVFNDLASGKIKGIGEKTGYAIGNQANKAGVYAVARSFIGEGSIAAAADRATGTTLNPYTALQFTGVGLRKHSFKFKLSPNSIDEALELQKIIRAFKERMLPEKNGLLFVFPDACKIQFTTPNMPYSFKTCYLESMSVNYAPSGKPSFFKGGEFATEVELSLEFGETEPVTRNDINDRGGDISGDGNPYASMSATTGLTTQGTTTATVSIGSNQGSRSGTGLSAIDNQDSPPIIGA